MKKLLVLAVALLIGFNSFAQEKKQQPALKTTEQTVVIQTNGVCSMCKTRFMENVPFFKGVKDCQYDMATSQLTVKYDVKRTSADNIRTGISKLGYMADNVPADAAAREKLPACCKADSKKATEKAGCHHNHEKCGGK